MNEPEKREKLIQEVLQSEWSFEQLRFEIKKLHAKNPGALTAIPDDPLLVPITGKLDTYRVVIAESGEWKGKPIIDVGFANYYRPQGGFSF